MFVAAAIKELRQCVLPTMVFLVSHYTMVAISQQTGEYTSHYTIGLQVDAYSHHSPVSQGMQMAVVFDMLLSLSEMTSVI
jgi:hypothetical protein